MDAKTGREQQLRRRIGILEDRAQKAACPIYGTAGKEGRLVGSGLLLMINGVTLLVTAAHVLEEKRQYILHLPGDCTIVPLEGTAYSTRVYDKHGQPDFKQDIAFVVLKPESAAAVRNCRVLGLQDLDVIDLADSETLYGFTGFPGSRNKPSPGRAFRPTSVIYTALAARKRVYSQVGYDSRSHLIVDFDRKRMMNRELRLLTGPDPHGVSGGPVCRLGTFSEIEGGMSMEKVAAIAIQWRKSLMVLVAVRTSLLVDCIRICLPDLASALPMAGHLQANVRIEPAF